MALGPAKIATEKLAHKKSQKCEQFTHWFGLWILFACCREHGFNFVTPLEDRLYQVDVLLPGMQRVSGRMTQGWDQRELVRPITCSACFSPGVGSGCAILSGRT